MIKLSAFFAVVVAGLVAIASFTSTDWRTASRESANIAPRPEAEPEAVVQIYAARAINWRGWFAVHTWIATKEKNASAYTVYDVMGWQLRRMDTAVRIRTDEPDRRWYGAMPYLVGEVRGLRAEAALPNIKAAADSYPYSGVYHVWPGPNSNTFISHILRGTREIGVELPANAIGKDFLTNGKFYDVSETGTGKQISFYGLLGVTAGKADGLEINVLGLNFGVDVMRPALKLPFVGRVGVKDAKP